MATIKDIASVAGVSVSTVSRALSGWPLVSETTRAKIKQIATDLGYVPNTSAQTLVGKGSKTIGVLVPELSSSYFATTLNYMEELLNQGNYTLIVGVDHYDASKAVSCLEVFSNRQVDGIFLVGSMHPNIKGVLDAIRKQNNLPIVFIHSFAPYRDYDYICVNDVVGSDLIVEHLKSLGHRRIGYIGAEFATRNRFSALMDSVNRNGLTLEPAHIKIGNDAYEHCGYTQTRALLQEENPPTALITAYDYVAIGAMRYLYEHNFRVPEDFAVVGYDNIREAEYLTCPLTTISPPIQEMVAIGVDLMRNKIRTKNIGDVRHITLDPNLMVRESTVGR